MFAPIKIWQPWLSHILIGNLILQSLNKKRRKNVLSLSRKNWKTYFEKEDEKMLNNVNHGSV
jgi:hypothetical protein